MRNDWTALPDAVVATIGARVGGFRVTPALTGDHAEVAATVAGPAGAVFVKAASSEFGVRSLRYELLVSRAVDRPYSSAVAWHFETDGWLVVGFEHCPGPHADLSPGSPDLDLLEAVVTDLGETSVPGPWWFTPSGRFGFTLASMDGDKLVHTDLNPTNLIVTPRGLRVVDWAMTTKAAPWVELAQLAPWLIDSGHTPEQAETWLTRFPTWKATAPDVLDRFAYNVAAKWSARADRDPARWIRDIAASTGRWSAYLSTKN